MSVLPSMVSKKIGDVFGLLRSSVTWGWKEREERRKSPRRNAKVQTNGLSKEKRYDETAQKAGKPEGRIGRKKGLKDHKSSTLLWVEKEGFGQEADSVEGGSWRGGWTKNLQRKGAHLRTRKELK